MSASALSAASTHDAGAAIALGLTPEASDAHIDNLTGLNDKASAAAGVPRQPPTPKPQQYATNW